MTEQIIIAINNNKIRDKSNPEKEIVDTILKIVFMLQIKSDALADVLMLGQMADGIKRHYPNYAPEELYLACELNHYGKYSEKVEHYGKFSIDYLSSCLKLYEEKKREAIHAERTKLEVQSKPVGDQKQLGYHHGRAYWLELVKYLKNEGKEPMWWDWGKCYEFLRDDGQLADYTKEMMEGIYARYKSMGKAEATTGRFSANTIGKMLDFNNLSADDTVKNECRKHVVLEVLRKKKI